MQSVCSVFPYLAQEKLFEQDFKSQLHFILNCVSSIEE